MPFEFAFGWGDYFSFTFSCKLGPSPPEPTKDTPKAETRQRQVTPGLLNVATAKINGAMDQFLQAGVAAQWARSEERSRCIPDLYGQPQTLEGLKSDDMNPQLNCLLFEKLPLEIRGLIYEHLLVSVDVIAGVSRLVGKERVKGRMLNNHLPIQGIDARVLRTCRKIYKEALPGLYGYNTFKFSNMTAVNDFKESGLVMRGDTHLIPRLVFNFQLWPLGRLSMVRKLCFNITADPRFASFNPTNGPSRDHICRNWIDFLVAGPGHYQYVQLPVLHTLGLDFTEWRLGPEEALFVDPWIKRFSQPGRPLSRLAIRGIQHKPTLDKWKYGLLPEGGVFEFGQ